MISTLVVAGAALTTSLFGVHAVPPAPLSMGVFSGSDSQTVRNLTGDTMRIVGLTGDGDYEGAPVLGGVLEPSGIHDFEIATRFLQQQDDVVSYELDDPSGAVVGAVRVHLHLSRVWHQTSAEATVLSGDVEVGTDDGGVTLLDPPGTTHTAVATDPAAQQIVADYCGGTGTTAACAFTPTERTLTSTPLHRVGTPVDNETDTVSPTQIQVSDTVTDTSNVSTTVTGELKLGPLFTAGLQHTWGSTTATAHAFTQSVTVNISPGDEGWIESAQPTITDTGTVVVQAGNTTWTLTGASFTQPDPDPARAGLYVMRQRPLSTPVS